MIKLYTIGFTKKTAQQFFDLLSGSEVEEIVDTRLNNKSQLAGFAKGEDLKFFAEAIGNMKYCHNLDFAPNKEMLSKYRKKEMTWDEYESEYLNLLDIRKVGKKVNIAEMHKSCLLCSEHTAEKCHRRLLAEYLQHIDKSIEIIHLT